MKIIHIAASFAIAAAATTATAAPFQLATYAESYAGPKTLTVEVASSAQGDKALIKVYGINHPWDGKVVMTTVRRDANRGSVEYVARSQGKEWVVMHETERGSAKLSLPGSLDLPLHFDRGASLSLAPAHIASDYERPEGAVK
jgi:hypothetical protein